MEKEPNSPMVMAMGIPKGLLTPGATRGSASPRHLGRLKSVVHPVITAELGIELITH
jgi:hypothetical protein